MNTETVTMNAQGRIVIPKKFRDELGLKAGENITLVLDENGLRLQTFKVLLERMRAQLKKNRPEGISMVDEFITERRENARREHEE